MAPSSRASLYPRGTVLQCDSCGKRGLATVITGHIGKSADCRNSPVTVISYPPGVNTITRPVKTPAAPTAAALGSLLLAPGADPGDPPYPIAVGAGFGADAEEPGLSGALEPPPDEEPSEEEPGEPEPDSADLETPSLTGASRSAAAPRPRGRPRGSRSMELRTGRTETLRVRQPFRVRLVVDVLASTVATMQAMLDDPEEWDFLEGTPSDFFDKVTEAFVLLATGPDGSRYEGVRLVRRLPDAVPA